MKSHIQKWGNSLAVRIPKAFAIEAQLNHNSLVDISFEDGKLVVKPLPKPKYTLEELLEKVTPENIHGEIDTGSAVGKEVW